MKHGLKTLGVCALAAAGAMTTVADEKQGFNLYPSIGYYNFLSRDDLIDDSLFYSIAAGYFFNDTYSLELSYLGMETGAPTDTDVDVEQFHLNLLVHLEREGDLQPYLAFGVGNSEFDAEGASDTSDETLISFATGADYFFTDTISWRTEVKFLNSLDERELEMAVATGVNFFFGSTGKASPAKPVAPSAKDSDNDGVNDIDDACPNTPRGVSVDASGCPLDSDKDGVADYLDNCPDTRLGAKVDDKGCYIVLTETQEVNLEVKFANNSDVVPQAFYGEIKEVADFMTQYPLTQVVIEGHTDDRGAASYNEDLSDRRAKAVAQVLVDEFNVDRSRVSSQGFGEARPIATNDTAEGRAANRRVVAVVSAKVETIAE